ncbi:hypothetical protein [Methanolobus bombayensis]|uniref:hypothetical protein n=1 Tax=Methanolobus bombayensis TaxID=38023 RepID=UPI001AE7BE79|nr:hypothetical protein [Methanolobus bombayensis]MBP1908235.1 hypothetical protein [Methanolobus bombayensis]
MKNKKKKLYIKKNVQDLRIKLINTLLIIIGFTFTGYNSLSPGVLDIWGNLVLYFFLGVFIIYAAYIQDVSGIFLDLFFGLTTVLFAYIILVFFYGTAFTAYPTLTIIIWALSFVVILCISFTDYISEFYLSKIGIIFLLVLFLFLGIWLFINITNASFNELVVQNSSYNYTEIVNEVFWFVAFKQYPK